MAHFAERNSLYLTSAQAGRSLFGNKDNMTESLRVLIPSAIGIFTTTFAAYLSARWPVRQAFQQRWWERKETAYTDIIESVHDLLRYSALCANDYPVATEGDHPKKKEFEERYLEAFWRIQRAADIGAFVISDEAVGILQKLRDRPELKWDENPPWEICEADCTHYREALAGIRRCAKRDLKV